MNGVYQEAPEKVKTDGDFGKWLIHLSRRAQAKHGPPWKSLCGTLCSNRATPPKDLPRCTLCLAIRDEEIDYFLRKLGF